jgi:hypothetical protein
MDSHFDPEIVQLDVALGIFLNAEKQGTPSYSDLIK